jgi:hypothetical protein
MHGVSASLTFDKKYFWHPFLFYIRANGFKYVKETVTQVEALTTFHFDDEIFRIHDPLNIINHHFHSCKCT